MKFLAVLSLLAASTAHTMEFGPICEDGEPAVAILNATAGSRLVTVETYEDSVMKSKRMIKDVERVSYSTLEEMNAVAKVAKKPVGVALTAYVKTDDNIVLVKFQDGTQGIWQNGLQGLSSNCK